MIIYNDDDFDHIVDGLINDAAQDPWTSIVLDLETTGLDPEKDRVCGVAIHGPISGQSYYFPFYHMVGPNLHKSKMHKMVRYLCMVDLVIGHNIKFDLRFMYKQGMGVPNRILDTMLGAHVLDENMPSFALKKIVSKVFGKKMIAQEQGLTDKLNVWGYGKGDMWRLSAADVAPYAIMDVEITNTLNNWLHSELEKQDLVDLWHDISQFSAPVSMMEHLGLHIDVRTAEDLKRECLTNMSSIKMDLYVEVGRWVNPNSPVQVSKLLSIPSTASKELVRLGTPLAKKILEYRSWAKMADSYYSTMLRKADLEHNIHPSLLMHGTYTGRMSCRDPNLQAIPRYDETHKVKDAFVARPGFIMVEADYSQAEIRVATHYAKESTMADLLMQGADIHGQTARMLNIDRNIAKRLNFGVIYGIGAFSLADQLDITEHEAKSYLNKYHKLYPGFRRLYNKAEATANKRGYITLYTGRRRRYEGKEDETHKASSNLVQGTVAEMVRKAITEIWSSYKDFPREHVRMILTVHDSILFEIKRGLEGVYIPRIKTVMESQPWCSIPMVVDIKQGRVWSKMEDCNV